MGSRMKAVNILILLVALHWTADYLLQPEGMGDMKAVHASWMEAHAAIHVGVMFVGTVALLGAPLGDNSECG